MKPKRKEEIRERYRCAELASRFRPAGLGTDALLIGELLAALDEAEKIEETSRHAYNGQRNELHACRVARDRYRAEKFAMEEELVNVREVVEAARDFADGDYPITKLQNALWRYDEGAK